jgi:hypothetical protein
VLVDVNIFHAMHEISRFKSLTFSYYVYFVLMNIYHNIYRVDIKLSVKFTMKIHYQNEFSFLIKVLQRNG